MSEQPVELFDVNPTICNLAGVPSLENIDARSLHPVLFEETSDHRTETISSLREFRCLRTPTHKLVQNYNDVTELYDLAGDPNELDNVAIREPDLVRSLRQRLVERYTEGKWNR